MMSTIGRATRKALDAVALGVVSFQSVVTSVFAEGDALIRRWARRRRLRRLRRRGWAGGLREASSGGVLDDLLMVGLLASFAGELASILADEAVLATVFFLTTLLVCAAVWKRNEA
jgi:hypothetical protein